MDFTGGCPKTRSIAAVVFSMRGLLEKSYSVANASWELGLIVRLMFSIVPS